MVSLTGAINFSRHDLIAGLLFLDKNAFWGRGPASRLTSDDAWLSVTDAELKVHNVAGAALQLAGQQSQQCRVVRVAGLFLLQQ